MAYRFRPVVKAVDSQQVLRIIAILSQIFEILVGISIVQQLACIVIYFATLCPVPNHEQANVLVVVVSGDTKLEVRLS
jgi:hypothetical protein